MGIQIKDSFLLKIIQFNYLIEESALTKKKKSIHTHIYIYINDKNTPKHMRLDVYGILQPNP